MSNSEQQLETEDMYDDELDCVYEEEENGTEEEDDEEGNEEMEVKEEKVEADNEIAVYRAVSGEFFICFLHIILLIFFYRISIY